MRRDFRSIYRGSDLKELEDSLTYDNVLYHMWGETMLTVDEVLISLECPPLDLAEPKVRASIKEASQQLETAGISPMRFLQTRSGTATAAFTSLGPYLVPIAQIVVQALGVVLVAWVKAPGRRVRVKIGDLQLDATSIEDIERLLPQLKEFQAKSTRRKPTA